jgi:hypothetical protein
MTEMTEQAPKQTKAGKGSGRALLIWSIAGVALLAAAVALAFLYTRLRAVQRVLDEHDSPNKQCAAVEAFGGPPAALRALRFYLTMPSWLAPEGKRAVGILGMLFAERSVAGTADVLVGLLGSSDPELRAEALWALGNVGPPPEAAGRMEALLADPDRGVRSAARWALGRIRPLPREALRAIVLAHAGELAGTAEEPHVRWLAALELGKLGRDAASAAPQLRVALKDKNAVVRARAARALWLVTGEVKLPLGTVADVLRGTVVGKDDEGAGSVAAETLMAMRASRPEEVGRLLGGEQKSLVQKSIRFTAPYTDRYARPPVAADREVRYRLGRKISFEFVQAPLDETLAELRKQACVKITVDQGTKLPAWPPPPITLKMTRASGKLALDWITKLAGLEYEIRDGEVFVAAPR